jgi:aspartate aminotransferase
VRPPFAPKLAERLDRMRTDADGALVTLNRARELQREGRDIVHFEIGDPDFPTPSHIVDAAYKAMQEGYTHYPPGAGFPELRSAIAKRISKTRGIQVDTGQVIVTPGSKAVMFYAMHILGEPGAEIICPNPGMPEFEAVARFTGASVVPVRLLPEKDYRIDLDHLESQLNEKTRLIMLVSPHNPTGSVYPNEDLQKIAELVKDISCYIFSDEIYSSIHFGQQHLSIATVKDMAARTIISDGFSKTYAMTGWRLGYGIFPLELVPHVINIQRNSVSAAAAFTQIAGLAALEGPQDSVPTMVNAYRDRRDVLVEGINRIPGISCPLPQGAFYAFPDIRGTGIPSLRFAEIAMEQGVALLAGTAFGTYGEGFIRLSYATGIDRINSGLERIESFVKKAAKR